MTEKEFSILVKGMKAIYAQPTFIPDAYAFKVWFSLLEDLIIKMQAQLFRNTCRQAHILRQWQTSENRS